jgi:ParB family chromosome partitioning protein
MKSRQALGKGIQALIPETGKAGDRVQDVRLTSIKTNIYQPRTRFEDDGIKELASSIREKGVIQPVLLKPVGGGYELIAGERRVRACRLLEFETVPAIVREVGNEESLELAIIENVQREDLNPMEEARAYRLLMDQFGLTQHEVGKKVGKERSSIANMLRLLNLPAEIQNDIEQGKLTMGHARALLACETVPAMLAMRKQILEYGLNVRDVEAKTRRKRAKKRQTPPADTFLRDLADTMQKSLSTRVSIRPAGKKGGKIIIEYYSNEDLDRIMDHLG